MINAIGEEGFAGFQLFAHLVVGWPAYLVTNATGARRLYNHKAIEDNTLDHFRPWSKLFPPNWERRIYVGTACWLAAFGGIMYSTYKFGFTAVACYYWGPYMWVNFWLVLYTWLQHTSPEVPHFGDDEWTWVRGALCTIDRPYAELFGFFDWMHHHIGSTHVCHHLFSNLPCYHAVEATKHVKAYLGRSACTTTTMTALRPCGRRLRVPVRRGDLWHPLPGRPRPRPTASVAGGRRRSSHRAFSASRLSCALGGDPRPLSGSRALQMEFIRCGRVRAAKHARRRPASRRPPREARRAWRARPA